ncbi:MULTISPECIES: NUDIX hydrolase [Staphylococcus]|uniref:ADP-ribose pyrophosphatase n=3 Tax=Staphylococcus equorum TaxID=246432 RepID=A0AAP7IC74_9STAP|nr:NUDIX hydrolase [Staphylococcus equorum]ANR68177.1 ADP-ribose pyrophosphatase [Staphylococcus equorum]ERH35274.1 ADP-ribose pyrophosphatase [Staphylococcus equorum UMC-CNS-924]MCE5006238.1 NUDIX hydrolase [Staphylococcus equorum]MCE5047412.1 NUDIX hydrolase [Staphylococcus equorum]MCM3072091.1 NUDIX hydrolase [Staphylococcus equorum]
MNLFEKTLHKESIYKGAIIDLEVHDIELPDGQTSKRELVYHNGAVAVCAINPDNQVILVRQYRKPAEKTLLEIPAGKLEINEERESAAKRELEEETGYIAENLELITEMYGSPGFSNEKISIYLAKDLKIGEMNLDDDEFIEIETYNIEEITIMLQNKEIEDAKTIIALQYLLLNYNHYK